MSEKLLKTIDELCEKYLGILEDVCNIESPTVDKKSVDKVSEYFIRMASEKNWKIETLKQDTVGDAVCITLNPDADNLPVCFSGHIDTVHPAGLFGYPPVTRDNDKMYGPGVMDCKGGVVASFMAMDALEKCGFKNRPVMLLIQSDEENNSTFSNKATINYICEKAKNAVAFLNTEGKVGETAVLQRKGILRYRYTITGKAAHSSICPEGANAVAEAAYKILKLEELKDIDGLTCNCGVINGGTTPNTVAEKCTFYADIRFATHEELERVRILCKEVAEASFIKGCSCELEEISLRPAMVKAEKNYNLLEKMNEIYKTCSLPQLEGRSEASGSDAAYTTEWGIPTVDNLGTEGGYIHSKDEFIYLKSLCESAKRLASVAFYV